MNLVLKNYAKMFGFGGFIYFFSNLGMDFRHPRLSRSHDTFEGSVNDYSALRQMTPLHRAAGDGDVEKVHALLNCGKNLIDAKDTLGATPLHYAVASGSKEVVRLLLEAGCHVKSVNDNNNSAFTLLVKKCRENNDPQQRDTLLSIGRYLVMFGAAYLPEDDVLMYYVLNNGTCGKTDLYEGLLYAACKGDWDSFTTLSLSTCEKGFSTIIAYAAGRGNLEFLTRLLEDLRDTIDISEARKVVQSILRRSLLDPEVKLRYEQILDLLASYHATPRVTPTGSFILENPAGAASASTRAAAPDVLARVVSFFSNR